MSKLFTPLLFTALASTAPGALIITEFMADALAVGDAEGEYFEVYNSGPVAIDVTTLTISDDGSDSIDLSGGTGSIPAGGFFVFGNNDDPYVNLNYTDFGSYFLANGADEIVVSVTGGNELARLIYSDGDAPGDGIANVLDAISNATGGVTDEANYMGEIAANNTLTNGDTGSPGVAGSTSTAAIPEPSSALLGGIAMILLLGRRR